QSFQAVDSGQPDVEQDGVKIMLLEQFEAGLATSCDRGRVAFVFQYPGEGFLDSNLVVHNQDVGHAKQWPEQRRIPERQVIQAQSACLRVCFLPPEWNRGGPP